MLAQEFYDTKSESDHTFDWREYHTCKFCGLTLLFQLAGSFPNRVDPFKEMNDKLEDHIMKYHRGELKKLMEK